MSEQLELTVLPRTETGKGPNARLRAEGFVPGVFYNAKGDNMMVKVKELPLSKLFKQVGHSHIITLKIDNEGGLTEKPCFIYQVQAHPVKNLLTHVDFYEVDLSKKVRVLVPVHTVGKSRGVEMGGLLEVFRDHLEIECLPLAIPNRITIDVSELEMNQNLQIADITPPEGVTFVYEDNFAVVGVAVPAAEEGAEGAEA